MEFTQTILWFSILLKTAFSARYGDENSANVNATQSDRLTESIETAKPTIRYFGDFDVSITLENVKTKFDNAQNELGDVFGTTLDKSFDRITFGSFKESFDETNHRQDLSFKIRYTFKTTVENMEFLPNKTAVNFIEMVKDANKDFERRVNENYNASITSDVGFDEDTFSKRKTAPIKLKIDVTCFQTSEPTCKNGSCAVENGTDTCICDSTHFGKLCAEKTCETLINNGLNPCQNKGKCSENEATEKTDCECVDGWQNEFCDGRNCDNIGTKEDKNQKCFCHEGWTGLDCETGPVCQNGASLNGVVCECPDGFTGVLCENEIAGSGEVTEPGPVVNTTVIKVGNSTVVAAVINGTENTTESSGSSENSVLVSFMGMVLIFLTF